MHGWDTTKTLTNISLTDLVFIRGFSCRYSGMAKWSAAGLINMEIKLWETSNVKSLKKIWNDEPFMNLRKNQLTGNYKKMPLCSGCDYLWQKTNRFGISEKNIYDGLLFVRENLNIPLKNQFHAVK